MSVVPVSRTVDFTGFIDIKEHRRAAMVIEWRIGQIKHYGKGIGVYGNKVSHFFNFEKQINVYSHLSFRGDVPSHKLQKINHFIDKVQKLSDEMNEALEILVKRHMID